MRKIILATGNPGKVREFRVLTQDMPIELLTAAEIGFHGSVEETGKTFAENAILKAAALAEFCGEWTIADDSGIVLPYLNGAPGIYSARFAGAGASDEENNQKLLRLTEAAQGEQRRAAYVAEIALVRPGFPALTFRGECWGSLLREGQGEGGFGYDPLFYMEEFGQTFAQIPLAVKNGVSHRGKALEQLKAYLLTQLGEKA